MRLAPLKHFSSKEWESELAGTIVSTYTTYALTLTSGSKQNPVSISANGTINAANYSAAIYGNDTATWVIQNDGVLESNGYGITLAGGSTITNGSASDTKALIEGYFTGIYAGKLSTIANFATIIGSSGTGIVMEKGGTLTNGSVTDTKALIYGGQYGAQIYGNNDLITNFGTISGGTSGTGIDMTGSSEMIVNGSTADKTALIYGYRTGFYGVGSVTLDNFGTMSGGTNGTGVELSGSSEMIVNGSTADKSALMYGYINGFYGAGSVTLDNFGSILASTSYNNSSGYGVFFTGGTVTNHGLIGGLGGIEGIYAKGGGAMVVVNAGTIFATGTASDAIYMYLGTRGGTLMVDPGAVFEGDVIFAHPTNASAVLALAGGTGQLNGIGTGFESFTSIAFETGGSWIVSGDVDGLAGGEVISGFTTGDEIILDGFAGTLEAYSGTKGLTIVSGSVTETIDIIGNLTAANFTVNHNGGDTEIFLGRTAPCFCAGTRIMTPLGDVAVEELRAGDRVITKDGEDAKIVWVGRRKVDVKRHPRPEAVRPVRFIAGALGDGVPGRHLDVSPDHALFLDGCLVPAKALVNGVNVRPLERDFTVYYHVELATHDVIFAEGVAVETYLETGNRGDFENGVGAVRLHPEFAQAMREEKSCAPFVETGDVVMRAREAIAARAAAGGSARRAVG
jgi:hypothetical protein